MKEEDREWVKEKMEEYFYTRFNHHKEDCHKTQIFDCPECKHRTMGETVIDLVNTGRRISSLVYAYSHPSSPPYLVDEVINKERTICLNCGKKFEKAENVWNVIEQ